MERSSAVRAEADLKEVANVAVSEQEKRRLPFLRPSTGGKAHGAKARKHQWVMVSVSEVGVGPPPEVG